MWLLRRAHEGTCVRARGPGGLGTPRPTGVRVSPGSSSGAAAQTRCQASNRQRTDQLTATCGDPGMEARAAGGPAVTSDERRLHLHPVTSVTSHCRSTVCIRVKHALLLGCLSLRKECGLSMETRAVLGWEARALQGPHVLREFMLCMEPGAESSHTIQLRVSRARGPVCGVFDGRSPCWWGRQSRLVRHQGPVCGRQCLHGPGGEGWFRDGSSALH